MITLHRNPERTEQQQFDLVVIGGGIYGVCMLWEASRLGWKTLLLERDDFGGATSFRSLRILHGGLRYLQHLDLPRFRQSVREQSWWLANFPDLVEPLPCLMPLYNQGLRRMDVLRCALRFNDFLARSFRRRQLNQSNLQPSRMLDASETRARFPDIRKDGLRGGALWYDVRMKSPQRLLIELLRWSVACGAEALNYLECVDFALSHGRVKAVKARCRVDGNTYTFPTNYVVNCAGPWVHDVVPSGPNKAGSTRADHALAFNLVLNRRPPSRDAIAVSGPSRKSQIFFVVPFEDRTMVGTQHLPPQREDGPTPEQVQQFLASLNAAIPDWNLCHQDVECVWAGRLPAQSTGSSIPRKSPIIMHRAGGLQNVTSVVGPKYTTARHVARKTVFQIARNRGLRANGLRCVPRPAPITRPDFSLSSSPPPSSELAQDLQAWIQQESILRQEDFLRRRDFTEEAFQQLTDCLTSVPQWPTEVSR